MACDKVWKLLSDHNVANTVVNEPLLTRRAHEDQKYILDLSEELLEVSTKRGLIVSESETERNRG